MRRPLLNTGMRYLLHHPGQTALMVLGIALGVAVVVAIDLANSAAGRAFELTTEAVAGRATHQIVGGPLGLDDSIYTRLRVEGGASLAAPIVTGYVTSPQLGERPIRLLGVDPFAEAPFRSYLVGSGASSAAGPVSVGNLTAFLTQPGALLLSEEVAHEHGLAVGDRIELDTGGRRSDGVVAGLLRPVDALSRRALRELMLADIATAQEITGKS
ncbi:MAG: ABC transporter permease, partial [Anaerolineae bacterium]